jgi:Flp pilus assembly pilin Flp
MKKTRTNSHNHALSRHTEGSTAIEFAIIAPALFLIMIGTVEMGLVLFTNAVLEGATAVASRVGKTGFTTGGQTREQYIRSTVLRLSGGYLTPSRLTVSTLSYRDFSNVGQPEPCITNTPCPGTPGVNFIDVNGNAAWDRDMGNNSAGGAGDVVLYRVSYPWALFTPLLRNIIGDSGGNITLTAVSTVRNEEF